MTTTDTPMTQAERRARTQRALLDATLEVLVADGFANTTTTAICARAGVSQGALFRYHETKADLLVAALRELFERLYVTFAGEFALLAEREDRIRSAVDALWDLFQRPDTLAALELYVAARTDADLAPAMRELELAHNERILALAAETLPDLADREAFRPTIRLVIDAIQGAAIRAVAGGDPELLAQEREALVVIAQLAVTVI